MNGWFTFFSFLGINFLNFLCNHSCRCLEPHTRCSPPKVFTRAERCERHEWAHIWQKLWRKCRSTGGKLRVWCKFLQDKVHSYCCSLPSLVSLFSLPLHQRWAISCRSVYLWKSTSPSASQVSVLNNLCESSVSFPLFFHSRKIYHLLMKNQSAFPPKATLENQMYPGELWTLIHLTSLIVLASVFILFQRWSKLIKKLGIESKAKHAFGLLWKRFRELWSVMETPVWLVYTWLNSWK